MTNIYLPPAIWKLLRWIWLFCPMWQREGVSWVDAAIHTAGARIEPPLAAAARDERERSGQIRPFSLFPITRTMEYHLGGQSWDNTQFSCFLPWTTPPASQLEGCPPTCESDKTKLINMSPWPSKLQSFHQLPWMQYETSYQCCSQIQQEQIWTNQPGVWSCELSRKSGMNEESGSEWTQSFVCLLIH